MADVLQQIPVEEEYKKNEDITAEDISRLRQWLETQPHLPGSHITDLDLILVYFCCERSSEVSKQVLDLHYTLRTLFEPFFKNRVWDSAIEATLNVCLVTPLALPSLNGYHSFYLRLLDDDARLINLNDLFRTWMMVIDLCQYEEGTWPGLVLTINMDNTTLGHITRLDLMTVKKIIYFVQESMFFKIKEIHFMNAVPLVDKLLMLLKPFVKSSLMDVMYVHPVGTDSLYKYVSKESLPKDDGGTYLSLAEIKELTKRRLQSNTEYFRAENLKRVNETLRPGGAAAVHDEFGVQGSFKKLEID